MLQRKPRRQPPPGTGAAAGPANVCGAQALTSSRSARSQLSIGSCPAPSRCSSYARSAICSCEIGAGAAARLRAAGFTARRTRLAVVVFAVVASFGMVRAPSLECADARDAADPDDTRVRPAGANSSARGYVPQPMAAADLDPAHAVADLRALRELTEDDRGAQRVAWTDTWASARAWLRERLESLPVAVDTDDAGNLWAILPGARDETVILGSHLDSVPDGGWLDGALGVLAGLEVLRAIAAAGEPPVTVALVDWADEEGARFGRSLLGSGLAAGILDPAAVQDVRDADGVALTDALAAHGVDLAAAPRAKARLDRAVAYLELHIEQGPVLERDGLSVGVVTGTAGVERHAVCVRGQAVQGGGFPMDARRDALVAAARLVLAGRAAADDERSRATVGTIAVRPAIPTAVPGECELVVDQRHPDADALAAMVARVHDAAADIAIEERVEIDFERIWSIDPIAFDDGLVALAEEVAREVTGASARLFSGALHDAAAVAAAGVPAAMLFVPSAGGISHAREEDTAREHIEAGVRALARLAERAIERASATGA